MEKNDKKRTKKKKKVKNGLQGEFTIQFIVTSGVLARMSMVEYRSWKTPIIFLSVF